MICKYLANRLINEEKDVIFHINGDILIAGYENEEWCIFYALNWKSILDGKLEQVSIYDIPNEFKNISENTIIIGNIKERSVNHSTYIIHLDSKKIDGHISFKINREISEILSNVDLGDTKKDIQNIYQSARYLYLKDKVVTWYPVWDITQKDSKNLYTIKTIPKGGDTR